MRKISSAPRRDNVQTGFELEVHLSWHLGEIVTATDSRPLIDVQSVPGPSLMGARRMLVSTFG